MAGRDQAATRDDHRRPHSGNGAEKELENVRAKLKELEITYPVMVDTDGRNWRRWQQQWWPTVYLIDRQGIVRYRWTGELDRKGAGGEAKMARRIRLLLKERA